MNKNPTMDKNQRTQGGCSDQTTTIEPQRSTGHTTNSAERERDERKKGWS